MEVKTNLVVHTYTIEGDDCPQLEKEDRERDGKKSWVSQRSSQHPRAPTDRKSYETFLSIGRYVNGALSNAFSWGKGRFPSRNFFFLTFESELRTLQRGI